MNILVINDDGINATGISALVKTIKNEHNVVVVAPEVEQSGCGHSITIGQSLKLTRSENPVYDGVEAYSLNGKPADCVKVAVDGLGHKYDLVLSGINRGENAGLDLLYSGTINSAMEGCISGLPSIALSQHIGFGRERGAEYLDLFESSAKIAAQIIKQIDVTTFIDHICSINFPDVKGNDIKGMRVCEQGIRNYEIEFDKTKDIEDREFRWNVWDKFDTDYNYDNDTDWKWLMEGYITVTPLTWNRTDRKSMPNFRCKINNLKLHF